MAKAEVMTHKDVFMQFKDFRINLDAADSSALVEVTVDTGLSVRGQLMWLCHLIEAWNPIRAFANPVICEMALSTRVGLAVFPEIGDAGLVFKASHAGHVITTGGQTTRDPHQLQYLPPIPLAAPRLSIYAQMDADEAAYRGVLLAARMGYTTTPLDAGAYVEIAETWGW